ncbi:MAG: MerR family transcriptional regulator [Kineosporiaceae bacterium]
MPGDYMQIGEVAALTNLSLRTIRHYEEVGLVVPSGRSQGGFRLYTDTDVQRLRRVRRMKPFFTLEEMADLLHLIDVVRAVTSEPSAPEPEVSASVDRLAMYRQSVLARVEALREQADQGEEFADELARAADAARSAVGAGDG